VGTWGSDTFQNDTAADWALELAETPDLSLVRTTLGRVVDVGDEYLEAADGERALAAAEVVARLKGNWGRRDAYSAPVDTWVRQHRQIPAEDLVPLADRAIERVLRAPSELLELWEEAGAREWYAAVAHLKARVLAPPRSVQPR
jgi:hypothetical protein